MVSKEPESYEDTLSYPITPLCHRNAKLTFDLPARIYVDGRPPEVPEGAKLLASCPECGAVYAAMNKGTDVVARKVENDDVEAAFAKLRMTLGVWPTFHTNDDGERVCIKPGCDSTDIRSDGENTACGACGAEQ